MAELTGTARKAVFSSQALLIVVAWTLALSWGVHVLSQRGAAWDGSGRGLGEARALVAELAADTRVTLVTPTPLERLLVPLARQTGGLTVTLVDGPRLAEQWDEADMPLGIGDVQVQSGDSWLVLDDPDFHTVLSAMALVSSPEGPVPAQAAPSTWIDPDPDGILMPAGAPNPGVQALIWALTGMLVPVAVGTGSLALRVNRRGR